MISNRNKQVDCIRRCLLEIKISILATTIPELKEKQNKNN